MTRIQWTCVALGLAVAGGATAQQDFDKVEIATTKVADGVWMLAGAGGNIGVSAGKDGVFVIDDQFAPLAPKILAAIRKVSDAPLRFVLNTHWHFDHTGGNEALGGAGAVIVAHDNVRKRLAAGGLMEAFQKEVPPAPAAALPIVTFGHDLTFHANGYEINAFHVQPAHTDGDAIVHFRGANVVHMGDIYFNGLYPAIDWGSGGRIDGMIAAVDLALLLMDDKTKVIPGHGPLSDKKGLQEYRRMLDTVSARVLTLMKEGKSVQQIVEAKPTAEFDGKWGKGFLPPDKWVDMVYQGLLRAGVAERRTAPETPK